MTDKFDLDFEIERYTSRITRDIFSYKQRKRVKEEYAEHIGKRESITRERVRQILHKAVWNNWNVNSKDVLKNHFGADIQIKFKYVKPNHVEFIKLIADNLREKHHI